MNSSESSESPVCVPLCSALPTVLIGFLSLSLQSFMTKSECAKFLISGCSVTPSPSCCPAAIWTLAAFAGTFACPPFHKALHLPPTTCKKFWKRHFPCSALLSNWTGSTLGSTTGMESIRKCQLLSGWPLCGWFFAEKTGKWRLRTRTDTQYTTWDLTDLSWFSSGIWTLWPTSSNHSAL